MTAGEDRITVLRDSAQAQAQTQTQAQTWTLSETRTFVYDLPAMPAPGTQSPKAPRLQKLCFQHCGQVQAGGWNCIFERHVDAAQTVTDTAYVWGLDLSGSMQGAGGIGGLLQASQNTGGGVPAAMLFVYDGNGNVTALVDAADGSVVARYDYSPFGMTVLADGPAAAANPWRFSSKEHDATGLVYYGYRYYSPELGRWINRDPADESGGINQLAFCSNRPSNTVDSLGLWERVGDSTSTIYEADNDWDRLEYLAGEVSGDWRDWVCIWPLPDASKWANYPIAKKCARADVSNLVATEGGAITMMPRTSGDPWLPEVDSVVGPADYYWSTGIGAANRLKSESREGKTPLQDVLLVGHSGSAYRDLHRDGGTMPFDASDVLAVATENSNAINEYVHAVAWIGPPKCWFTRNAEVRGLGCQTHGTWAPYWAGTLMRSGSTTFGTRNYVLAVNPLFFFATYLRMSNSTSRSGAYGSKVYGRSELHLMNQGSNVISKSASNCCQATYLFEKSAYSALAPFSVPENMTVSIPGGAAMPRRPHR
jgi:RHS repeat-associated protein